MALQAMNGSFPCRPKSPTDGMIRAFRLNRAPCRSKAAVPGSSHHAWLDLEDLAGTGWCKDSAERASGIRMSGTCWIWAARFLLGTAVDSWRE